MLSFLSSSTRNCECSNFNLHNIDQIFQGNEALISSLPNKNWYNKNSISVFICGAYKTGKTTLVSEITNDDNIVGDNVVNTKGEYIYNVILENKNIIFYDCEGFYQPSVTIESDFLQKFIINHLFSHGDYLIYVVERMFKHDIELLKDLIEIYKYSDSFIKNFIIVHNYKDIETIDKLKLMIEKDVISLFDAEIENNENNDVNVFISRHGNKNIYHYVLGNFTKMKPQCRQVIDFIRTSIINCVPDNKIDQLKRNDFITIENESNMFEILYLKSLKETLFEYFIFNSRDNIIKYKKEDDYIKYFVDKLTPRDQKFDIWNVSRVYIHQEIIDGEILRLTIECAGLKLETVKFDYLGSRRIIISGYKVNYSAPTEKKYLYQKILDY